MFNLEQAIAEWRRQMSAAGIKTPVPLEELENHLREDFDAQIRAGAAPERAFETAVQKIGSASAIKSEFKKVDATKEERVWALQQKLIIIFTNLISLGTGIEVFFKPGGLSQITSGQQMSSLAAVATFTLLVWSGRLGYGLFPVIRVKGTRDVIVGLVGVSMMLWSIVFFNLILPRYDFTMGRLFVAIIWALFTPAGLFLGIVWGIETSTRKKVGKGS
jgi:hypothetical protein